MNRGRRAQLGEPDEGGARVGASRRPPRGRVEPRWSAAKLAVLASDDSVRLLFVLAGL